MIDDGLAGLLGMDEIGLLQHCEVRRHGRLCHVEVLAKLAGTDDAGKVLDAFNPPQPEFKALRAKLAELRSSKVDEPKPDAKPVAPQVRIPEGKILRPGMKDERVIALRKRLDIAGDKNDPRYDG